ncbi:MAG: hypothetical protein AB8B99_02960 [Phormidesmis sp.]
MNNTVIDVEPNRVPYVEPKTERTYTAVEIAEANSVTDATIRNGWFKWISQVAPVTLLKDGRRFTHLACSLYSEFASVKPCDRKQWVRNAKAKYAHEFSSAGVIDCDVMPAEVGSTLALMETANLALHQANAADLSQVLEFIDELNTADTNLTEQQVHQYAANGQKAAIAQFKIEEIAKQQTLNQLRQRRMGGGEQS